MNDCLTIVSYLWEGRLIWEVMCTFMLHHNHGHICQVQAMRKDHEHR